MLSAISSVCLACIIDDNFCRGNWATKWWYQRALQPKRMISVCSLCCLFRTMWQLKWTVSLATPSRMGSVLPGTSSFTTVSILGLHLPGKMRKRAGGGRTLSKWGGSFWKKNSIPTCYLLRGLSGGSTQWFQRRQRDCGYHECLQGCP